MIVLGLTGSIGMGKTATAALFAEAGVPVYDADAAVHALYDFGGAAVEAIEAAFPGATGGGFIDRKRLGDAVLDNPEALTRLERIVHPLLAAGRAAFLERARAAGAEVAVLDIPLLFETGGDTSVDAVVVVSASEPVQRERVLARPGMTEEKFEAIRARQSPDADKRARADFIIDTGRGIDSARAQVGRVLAAVADPGFRPRRARPSDTLDETGEPPH